MSVRFEKLSDSECLDEIDYIRGIYWTMKWDNMPEFTYIIINRNENPKDFNNKTLRNIQIFDLLQTPNKSDDKFIYYGWEIIKDDSYSYLKKKITIINPTYEDTLNKKDNTMYKYNDRKIWIEVRYL
jgi:hypothetical protein